ncbi:hypothetical protein [Wolbachia endosymbiont of Chironomus riparius]|uniref:hypothetical protein n=1 Tax=Wolbachia endosymbiont of Chironomus riparius TaxID=2883238 RepID=UPI00209CA991|nr:hypothetical protein [Wolbachia endosymbiont of Chironomus riparius]
MPSFFDKYTSFESRVNAAIDEGDAKLVQVLLGPKYCQLWQYWLVHGIIASKALNMERITHARLFLSIIDKQEKILEEQKKLLEERKEFLKNSNKENTKISDSESEIKKSRHFIRDLLIATRDAVVECKDNIVMESNQKISYREFYIPENLLNDEDGSAKELKYVIQQISTVSSAEALSLTNEVDSVISEINEQIDNEIWKQSDISTRNSYYLDKTVKEIERISGGENSRLIDQVLNTIPENIEIKGRNIPFTLVANGVVMGLRLIPNGLLKLTEGIYDNINAVSCVEDNLKEIERFVTKIKEIAEEKEKLSKELSATHKKIKEQVIERIKDGKFIDKKFVNDVYQVFLYNYLNCASRDPANLLYDDLQREECGVQKLAEEISKMLEGVEYEKFKGFLNREISKKYPNFDVISVLIVNSAPLFSFGCIDHNSNKNLQKLMGRSFQTVMIDVHNLLFNFKMYDPKVDVSLLSFLPNKNGSYNGKRKDIIVLKGNKKYQAVLKEVEKFCAEIDELAEKGGLNRIRGYWVIPNLWYSIYDFSKWFFSQCASNSEEECEIIDEKIRELLCKITHSIATGNEGMMQEYIEKAKKEMNDEQNSDVRELYKIVINIRFRDYWFEREDKLKPWLSAPEHETLANFIHITSERVKEFDTIQIKVKLKKQKKVRKRKLRKEGRPSKGLNRRLKEKERQSKGLKLQSYLADY